MRRINGPPALWVSLLPVVLAGLWSAPRADPAASSAGAVAAPQAGALTRTTLAHGVAHPLITSDASLILALSGHPPTVVSLPPPYTSPVWEWGTNNNSSYGGVTSLSLCIQAESGGRETVLLTMDRMWVGLDRDTGVLLFQIPSRGLLCGCALNTIVSVSPNGDTYSVSPSSGETFSLTPALLPGTATCSLAANAEMVFATTASGALVGAALVGEPGPRVEWSLDVGPPQSLPPLLEETGEGGPGVVTLSGTQSAPLVTYSAHSGQRLWVTPLPLSGGLLIGPPMAALHHDTRRLFLALNTGAGGMWMCVDLQSGAVLSTLNGPTFSSGGAGAGLVVDVSGSRLFATLTGDPGGLVGVSVNSTGGLLLDTRAAARGNSSSCALAVGPRDGVITAVGYDTTGTIDLFTN